MQIKVWDPFVRLFHWSVVILFLTNYWLIESGSLHDWLGYTLAALVAMRLIWGVIGSPYARFSNFFPTPRRLKSYLSNLMNGQPTRNVGHNPIGSMMILILLSLLIVLSISGWMIGLDMFWGVDWVETLHETTANIIQILVVFHVAAVLAADLWHKEGLLKAMITGWKRMDVDRLPQPD
ncbi:MAG: cytochrome b/b6 domain-containing protein [Gammaproteobacteria bacterium]|nr:cytochrome b/b6 domain-containing protein [Gammaproteobacteria bacterium]